MAGESELKRLLGRAGVTPYRRVGKVRAAYDPRTPGDTVKAAVEAVRRFAPKLVDVWGEPSGTLVQEWRQTGLTVADVCDDPCPADVDPAACPPSWLVTRCARYHFRLTAPSPGKLLGVGLDGWQMDAIRPLLPAWFVEISRKRTAELVAAVGGELLPEPVPQPARIELENLPDLPGWRLDGPSQPAPTPPPTVRPTGRPPGFDIDPEGQMMRDGVCVARVDSRLAWSSYRAGVAYWFEEWRLTSRVGPVASYRVFGDDGQGFAGPSKFAELFTEDDANG